MVRRKAEKAVSLIVALLMIALMFVPSHDELALRCSSPWWTAFTYEFIHANIFHLAVNILCLLGFVFNRDLNLSKMLTGYAAGILYGLLFKSSSPVAGLSVCIFSWIGMYSLKPIGLVARLKYNAYVALWLLATWVMNIIIGRCMAVEAHIICYLIGVITAIINQPITTKKNVQVN